MNRRSFFKMITGFAVGVYAAFLPSKKTDAEVFKGSADFIHGGMIDVKTKIGSRDVVFHGRRIIAIDNFITWSECGDYGKFGIYNWMFLPTHDSCVKLENKEGELFWHGRIELWRLRPLEDNDLVFQAECLQIGKGYETVILNPNHVIKMKVEN